MNSRHDDPELAEEADPQAAPVSLFPFPDPPPVCDWPRPRAANEAEHGAHMRPAYAEPVWDAGVPRDALRAAEEYLGI